MHDTHSAKWSLKECLPPGMAVYLGSVAVSQQLSPHHPNHQVRGAVAQVRGPAAKLGVKAGGPTWTTPASESPETVQWFQSALLTLSARQTCFASVSNVLPTITYNIMKQNH